MVKALFLTTMTLICILISHEVTHSKNREIKKVEKKIQAITPNQNYIENYLKSNVLIKNRGMIGSGFFISKSLIATNYHVIKDVVRESGPSKDLFVMFEKQNGKVGIAYVAFFDKGNDLAILKSWSNDGIPLKLGMSSKIKLTDEVVVIGSPQGLQGTVSTGIVSARRKKFLGFEELIQTSAPISPGSSGSPVISKKTRNVIGVATIAHKESQSLNFFIPIVKLKILIKKNMKNIKKMKNSIIGQISNKAKNGSKTDQSVLGIMYFYGIYFNKNYEKAKYWLLKDDSSQSYSYLGAIYYQGGYGIKNDYNKAKKYLLNSVDRTESLHILGMMHLEGKGFPSNKSKAINYFLESSKKSHLPSQKILGYIYHAQGRFLEASFWFLIASLRDPNDQSTENHLKQSIKILDPNQISSLRNYVALFFKGHGYPFNKNEDSQRNIAQANPGMTSQA